jgi:hypothetical protein
MSGSLGITQNDLLYQTLPADPVFESRAYKWAVKDISARAKNGRSLQNPMILFDDVLRLIAITG